MVFSKENMHRFSRTRVYNASVRHVIYISYITEHEDIPTNICVPELFIIHLIST